MSIIDNSHIPRNKQSLFCILSKINASQP